MMKNTRSYLLGIEKTDKTLIFLLIFAFLLRIAFLYYLPFRGWDETVYLNLGRDLSIHPFFYSLKNALWNDFIPSSDVIYSWPNIGFRAPLLPYILSVFYSLGLDFLIPIIILLFATTSIYLVYFLGKKMFDAQVGLYSAILFALTPLHILYSQKIWTDPLVVFFILLTFISFWEGYENGKKKYALLFGFFLALSILARYTALWIAPVFLIYFLIRDRSFKFLRDQNIWRSSAIFFLTLTPWFIYGFKFYNNIIGAFIHGYKAASYWGGAQSWNFFFMHAWQDLSILTIFFISALLYILLKKQFVKKEIYLLLIWIVFFSILVIHTPHKEERFILPIIPAICLICGFSLQKIKKYKHFVLGLICIILITSSYGLFKNEYEESIAGVNICFIKGNMFLVSRKIDKNSLVITNQLPIVHYYTQKEVKLYLDPWNLNEVKSNMDLDYSGRKVYIFYANYDMKYEKIKNDLDKNFKKVLECSIGEGNSVIYEYH